MEEKTVGLNDFSVIEEVKEDDNFVTQLVKESITQDEAFDLLAENENYHLEVYVDGFWDFVG